MGKEISIVSIFSGSSCHDFEEVKLSDSQYNASSVYTHDTDDEYLKREYAPLNARLNNMINGGKNVIIAARDGYGLDFNCRPIRTGSFRDSQNWRMPLLLIMSFLW